MIKMTRQELIDLGKRIVALEGTEKEHNALTELFDKNVPRPNGSSSVSYTHLTLPTICSV